MLSPCYLIPCHLVFFIVPVAARVDASKTASRMIIMPQALLTARLCPRGAEATVFAILAGFQNFGANIGPNNFHGDLEFENKR